MPSRISVQIILASSSPRRADLLKKLGFNFKVLKPETAERITAARNPAAFVQACAKEKAGDVAKKIKNHHDTLVIAADTVVVLNKKMLGKPRTQEEALAMLKCLSGKTHNVLTGVALRFIHQQADAAAEEKVFYDTTKVTFKKLSSAAMRRYIRTGEPMDKAGAYAIQGYGAHFVKQIEGCFFNVVGLPVFKLGFALKELKGEL